MDTQKARRLAGLVPQSGSTLATWLFDCFGLFCLGLLYLGRSLAQEVPSKLEVEFQIQQFCGECHKFPNPLSFDRDRWHYEVRRGYEFYAKSGRSDLSVPPLNDTLAYFRSSAPEKLPFSVSEDSPDPLPIQFKKEELFLGSGKGILPEIGYLRWAKLSPNEPAVLLATDVRYGQVVAIDLRRSGRRPPRLLAQLRNPGRVELCDLDRDGQTELLVADLGSYLPEDHLRSRLIMLDPQSDSAKDTSSVDAIHYVQKELLTGLGRVSDVRAADLDNDGRLELAIAEFGWRDTGRLQIARSISDEQPLQFRLEQVDDRPGAMNVRIDDFDGDGTQDLVALFSQEYESVDLYRSRGSNFVRAQVWSAPDLTYGFSGLELADLNGDGAIDLLLTNGDAYDNSYLSPWHGASWLENRGDGKFKFHRLTEMPGAYHAQAADLDNDGLMDVCIAARLPPDLNVVEMPRLASLVLLHQRSNGQFDRHTLEWDLPNYPCLVLADFDEDGDTDIAVASGPLARQSNSAGRQAFLTVWWNQSADLRQPAREME